MEVLLRFDRASALLDPLFDRYSAVKAGAPGRCPACDEFGFIDHADARRAVQRQHCRACGYRWEYEFRDDGVIYEVRGDGPPIKPRPPVAEPSEDEFIDLRDEQDLRDRHYIVLTYRHVAHGEDGAVAG